MIIVGHRGARGLAPENTIAALEKALEHHVDMVEVDVRVSRDGVPLLHHDKHLIDPNGKKLLIKEHSFQELLAHKQDLAVLQDALVILNNKVKLYIEVKPHEPTKSIVRVIKSYIYDDWQPDQLILASFSQQILLELQAELPDIPKLVLDPWSGVNATRRARQLNTKNIAIDQHVLWSGFIRAMKRGGYHLYAYTLNDPRKARRWERYGLYGVITDYPDRFEKPSK